MKKPLKFRSLVIQKGRKGIIADSSKKPKHSIEVDSCFEKNQSLKTRSQYFKAKKVVMEHDYDSKADEYWDEEWREYLHLEAHKFTD